MNNIENIENQKWEEIPEEKRAWCRKSALGPLYSEYRGVAAHIAEQMKYALEEHAAGEEVESVRRSHATMLRFSGRLCLLSEEIARRIGGDHSSANVEVRDGAKLEIETKDGKSQPFAGPSC